MGCVAVACWFFFGGSGGGGSQRKEERREYCMLGFLEWGGMHTTANRAWVVFFGSIGQVSPDHMDSFLFDGVLRRLYVSFHLASGKCNPTPSLTVSHPSIPRPFYRLFCSGSVLFPSQPGRNGRSG